MKVGLSAEVSIHKGDGLVPLTITSAQYIVIINQVEILVPLGSERV